MKKKQPSAPSGAPFIIAEDVSPEEVYADGAVQLTLGPLISKILFYHATSNDPVKKIEIREPAFRLSIPTPALLDLATFVLQNAYANRDKILESVDQQYEKFRKALRDLQIEKTE